MASNYPVATIVIANHNYGKYITDAVDSALAQQYPPDRLMVYIVDDASTDDSWEILEKQYFSKFRTERMDLTLKSRTAVLPNGIRLCAIHSPKSLGPSEARNIIINSTLKDSDAYAILDADDIYHPTKLISCINMLFMDERIGVVYTDYDILNVETGNVVREYKEPFDKFRLVNECIVHSGAVIKKKALTDVFEETGFYDRTMRTCEDYDLWLRISDKYMITHIPESMSLVRVHKANATFSVKNEVWQQNWRRVREKMIARNGQ